MSAVCLESERLLRRSDVVATKKIFKNVDKNLGREGKKRKRKSRCNKINVGRLRIKIITYDEAEVCYN